MKKIIAAAACIAAVFCLCACVPTESTEVLIGPEAQDGSVEFNFDQLHNDTLTGFDGCDMYFFVQSMDISGSNEDKMIYADVTVLEDTEEELLDVLAAAILRRINDAAMYQDYSITESTALDMGSLWKKYGCRITVYSADEDGEKGDVIKEYSFAAGEDSGLSPDTETYEAEWLRQMEILERNAQ